MELGGVASAVTVHLCVCVNQRICDLKVYSELDGLYCEIVVVGHRKKKKELLGTVSNK